MNLSATRVVLRPRSVSEIMDLGLRFDHAVGGALYRRLALVVLVPCWLVCMVLRFAFDVPWELVWLVAIGLAWAVQGPFTIAASRLMVAHDVTVREVLGRFLRRLPSYVAAWIIGGLFLALGWGLVWLVLPPAWATIMTAHVHEASLVEEASPIAALGRARALARGASMRVLGLQILRVLAAIAFVLVFELLVGVGVLDFGLQLGRPFGRLEWGGSPVAVLGLFLCVPYLATTRFLHYIDTRTRRDGWDVQVRCLAVAAADEEETAA